MKTNLSETFAAAYSNLSVMPTVSGHAMLLSAEEFPIYHLHITRFLTEYSPLTEAESSLVQRIADNHWRLDRLSRIEMGLYARGRVEFADLYPDELPEARPVLIEAQVYLTYSRQLNTLAVQENRLRRYIDQDTLELKRLQAERAIPVESPKTVVAKARTSAAAASRGSNGFEFSDSTRDAAKPSTKTDIDLHSFKPVKPTRH